MNDIAERLHELMRMKDLSYSDLSRLTGIPKSALQRYATGTTPKIPMDRIESIASALHISPAYLMGWEEELMVQIVEDSASGRTAAKEEMHRLFGAGHSAADLRICGDKVSVLYYKALERHSAPELLSIIQAVENLPPAELEKAGAVVRAYLKADAPIKEIVDTALKPYRKDELPIAGIG